MVKLSLCIIVKNEEAFLEQCLQSVQGLVDEIVIVDTGSTDQTKEIAAKFTDKIFNFQWCDDFAAARNESLKHATGDWVLVLDADEVIAKEDQEKIRKLISQPLAQGYSLIQRSYTNDSNREGFILRRNDAYGESSQFSGWTESHIVRLFPNHRKIQFKGVVHELVEDSLLTSGLKTVITSIPIHHYCELKGAGIQKERRERYKQLCLKKIIQSPDYRGFFELGHVFKQEKDYEKAAFFLKKALELKPAFPEASSELGVVLNALRNSTDALKILHKCTLDFSGYAQGYFRKGLVQINLNQLKEAEQSLLQGLELEPFDITARINLAAVYEKLGNFSNAKLILEDVLKVDSKSARAYYNLGVVFEKMLNPTLAVSCYEKALELGYKKEELPTRIAKLKEFIRLNQ